MRRKYHSIQRRKGAPRIALQCAILALTLAVCVSLPVNSFIFASDTSNATYSGVIRVSNNGTDASYVSVNCTISTQDLIDADYINDSCNNTAIVTNAGADTAYMPAPGNTTAWSIWVPSISESDSLDYLLYAGGTTDMAGKIRYFPGSGGMTTTDSASLELGDNFSIEQSGWVDTSYSANKTLIYKEDAFVTYISGTGNITSAILGANVTWVSPTGFVDSGANWTDEAYAYDDDTGTKAISNATGVGVWTSYLELTHSPINISSIRFNARADYSSGVSEAIDVDVYYGGNWVDVYEGAYTRDTWETKPVIAGGVTAARVRLKHEFGTRASWLWEFDFGSLEVTATGISSGEHTVKTTVLPVLSFYGANDRIELNGATIIRALNRDFTMVVWFKATTYGTNTPSIFTTGNSGASIGIDTSGQELALFHTLLAVESPTVPFNLDTWYHAAITIGSGATANFTIYLDGAIGDNGTTTSTFSDSTSVAMIGKDAGSGVVFDGTIGGVWVYNRALTSQEVQQHYNGTYSDETDLIGCWRLDDASGAIAYDNSTSSNNGTIIGASWNATSPVLRLDIDDGQRYVFNGDGASVPDNSANWTFLQNDVMPYMEYHKITVSGTLQQHIVWENDASTFSDQSGNSHDATPTFRTSSSDANVSAVLLNFTPMQEAEAEGWSLTATDNMVGAPAAGPGSIPEMYTELDTSHIPGAGVADDILADAGVSKAMFWFPIPFLLIIATGIIVYSTTRSLLTQVIIMAAGLGFFATMGPLPFLVVIIFMIDGLAVVMAGKQMGW